MEYTVLENLVEIKLKNFIEEYKNTSKLFENTDVQNRLLHPGEYGIYKEKLISKLFEFTLPRKYSVGTGFIVNSQKEIKLLNNTSINNCRICYFRFISIKIYNFNLIYFNLSC